METAEELKERVSTLEIVLGEFLVQTNKALNRMEKDTQAFKEEMKQWREQSDKNIQAFQKEMRQWREQSDKTARSFEKDTNAWRSQSAKDTDKFKKEMNKKWDELSNRLGTIAEDFSAPNMRTIALQYFQCKQIDFFALDVERVSVRDENVYQEFDVVVVAGDYLFINETKSKAKPEYAREFAGKMKNIFDFFPEYQDKQLIPVFASFSIPKNVVQYLTKHNIYAMVIGGETMELLNYDILQRKNKKK